MNVFEVHSPKVPAPIVLSSPHSGTKFPDEVRAQIKLRFSDYPEDTDWFIDQLYDFAPGMGITLIHANYSRYVVDLNRAPDSEPLYDDGRVITGLVPVESFAGEKLYETSPQENEIERRKEAYYLPYHEKVRELLEELRQTYDNVLFFDAHSIKKSVPLLSQKPFPDLILGHQDGKTASSRLTTLAARELASADYSFAENDPFKGGFLTRSMGQPEKGVHALQLEMAQTVYMDADQKNYDTKKADEIRTLLKRLFTRLLDELGEMNS